MEMMVAEKAESFDAPPFSRKDHDDIESRGEIAGTSPRSVLGPWEMIGVGRLHSSHNNCQAATDALYPSCSQNNCPGIIPNIDLNIEALQDFVGQAEWKTLRKDDFMHLFRNDWQVYTSEQGKLHSSSGPRLMTEGIREVPKILNKKLCRDKRGSASSFKISPNLMHLTPPLVKPLDSGTGLLNIEECSHMALGLSGKPDKQKRKRQRWVSDPLLVLGPDILFLTFSYLDAHSLAQCLLVSQDWQALAAADCLWGKKLEIVTRKSVFLNLNIPKVCCHSQGYLCLAPVEAYHLTPGCSWQCRTGAPVPLWSQSGPFNETLPAPHDEINLKCHTRRTENMLQFLHLFVGSALTLYGSLCTLSLSASCPGQLQICICPSMLTPRNPRKLPLKGMACATGTTCVKNCYATLWSRIQKLQNLVSKLAAQLKNAIVSLTTELHVTITALAEFERGGRMRFQSPIGNAERYLLMYFGSILEGPSLGVSFVALKNLIDQSFPPEFANEEVKKFNKLMLQAQKALCEADESVDEENKRDIIMENHIKRVEREIFHTQCKVENKRREIDIEKHMTKLSEMESGKI
eukprot:Gb_27738 [translate_table: standard]